MTAQSGPLQGAIARLVDILDAETRSLQEGLLLDWAASAGRKSLALVEIDHLMRVAARAGQTPDPAMVEALKQALGRNEKLLRERCDAARYVVDLIQGAIVEARSDGTYGARRVRGVR